MKWGGSQQTAQALQSLDGRGINEADQLVDQILKKAIKLQARSIHIEPKGTFVLVRCRVGEKLYTIQRFSKHLHTALVRCLKLRADLDSQVITPQEGEFTTTYSKIPYTVQLSSLPGLHGEQLVLYLVTHDISAATLEEIGFWGKSLTQLSEFIAKSRGLLVLTGDTVSNEQLLRRLREELHHATVTIATINPSHEPLEAPSIPASVALQLAIKESPDIITISSLRGADMTVAALEAAKRHLVIAVVTAPSAGTSLALLQHWSSDQFLLAQLLLGVVLQRPALLLSDSKTPVTPSKTQLQHITTTMPNLAEQLQKYRQEYKLAGNGMITAFSSLTTSPSTKTASTDSLCLVQVSMANDKLRQLLIASNTPPSALDTTTAATAALPIDHDLIIKACAGFIDWKRLQ